MQSIPSIKKRDGRIVDFNPDKITEAIWNAAQSVGGTDRSIAEKITLQVTTVLEVLFKDPDNPPSVEQIQDLVEKILIEGGHAKTAKAYIIYRATRSEERNRQESVFGKGRSTETLNLSERALHLLKENFLIKDSRNNITETPEEMFRRIAHSIATPDALFKQDVHATEKKFFEAIQNFEFIPNDAILKNAGARTAQLSNDFAISVDDNLDEIFSSLKKSALLYKNGGAVGISFSKLRPDTDSVQGTIGISSGPVSFIELFTTAANIIQKGAPALPQQMVSLRIDHPNILEFIQLTESPATTTVILTPAFINAVKQDTDFALINPRTGTTSRTISARMLCDTLISNIWQHNLPKIAFQKNETEEILTPNGYFLEPNETIHTASINLTKMFDQGGFNWKKLTETVSTAVHFLDNAIEAHSYTLTESEEISKTNRKIELSPIGFAETLKKLNIEIDSDEATSMIGKIAAHIHHSADETSKILQQKRSQSPTDSERRHKTLTGFHQNKTACLLANLKPNPFENTDALSQFTFHKTIQSEFDINPIPTITLGQESTINDVEQTLLEAYALNCQGLTIARTQQSAIETELPQQLSISERDHVQNLPGVQEVIPPPMVEMSRIVKETLNRE